ncbi:Na+/H+ antiporter subunit E [Roseomonas sp. OT10]|uniref:Na+/H+ antiporter subunit E n=1 Tax=Roseomonas cutis TaxID=2897332 RepID=UPI001E4A54D9|nr:Na+/H+ antiporter subunit E [Roseomonas sp. OT10]UFN47922.1 Na+/H+ antiporter subunit E [Roseomonas sp. OT10]
MNPLAWPGRIVGVVALLAIFVADLVVASLAVARIVLRRPATLPAIVVVPSELRTAWGTVIFANFLSLTPGSTCLHVSEDRRKLYVHLLHTDNPDREAERFKRMYERWIRMVEGPGPRRAEEDET